jgi:hypothetical protein
VRRELSSVVVRFPVERSRTFIHHKGMTTEIQKQVLAGLANGPVSLRDAFRNGPDFVKALCLLTKRKAAPVVFVNGAYRLAVR